MRSKKRATAILVAASIGFVVGAGGLGFTLLNQANRNASETSREVAQDEKTNAETFAFGTSGTNDSGQTYGPMSDLDEAPDLFEAAATNGMIGYIKTDEWRKAVGMDLPLEDAQNWTPQEASVPVYDLDGVTVIGESIIFAPDEAKK